MLMEEYFKGQNLFGEGHESPDPVIHFYEDFLREYDPKKKMEMGVFYTPLPVVRFIVRSIDDILKKEFGITKGLADSSRVERIVDVIQKNGTTKKEKMTDMHRVQLLDVAVGTGTFLNETVNHIYESFKGNEGRWGAYVQSDLLPRLHGFELMMASYTIAHLKLAMTLSKTGVTEFSRRLGVYLTNTLDDAHDIPLTDSLFGVVDSIAQESKLASQVKKEYPIMVVMGNQPYSGISQNKHYKGNEVYKVEIGGNEKLNERKHWLDDDYVKFIRFAESMVEKNGEGVVGMITAHGYIDNPTFRGMRWHLRKTFDALYVLDLHGNSNKKETSSDGSADMNVFDIKTGVSILFGIKKRQEYAKKEKSLATVYQADLYGKRAEKFKTLSEGSMETIKWNKLPTDADVWKMEGDGKAGYVKGFSVAELFPIRNTGVCSQRDEIAIQESPQALKIVLNDFLDLSEEEIRTKYHLKKDGRDWTIKSAKEDVKKFLADTNLIRKIDYRIFDTRYTFFTRKSKGFIAYPRGDVFKHLDRDNLSILLNKTIKNKVGFNHIFVSKNLPDLHLFETANASIYASPLYLYADSGEKVPNLDPKIVKEIEGAVGTTAPEDILDYVYAVLHSPSYRAQYAEFLKSDFPRVPYPKDKEIFWKLVLLGTKLRGLHLLTDPAVLEGGVTFPVSGSDTIDKITYDNGKVYINPEQYFGGVPKEVFEFYIGGYQPAQKWLKDRKGRTLLSHDFEHYEKIIASLSKTIETMKEIDTLFFTTKSTSV